MRESVASELDRWTEDNNRYLAASLHWLRLLLQTMLPAAAAAPGTTQAVAPVSRGWFARAAQGDAPRVEAAPIALPAPQASLGSATDARAQAAQTEPPPALLLLAERLGLNPFERDVLLLCAAMELDPALPGLLQAVHGVAYPSFGLALQLFEQPSWDALSAQRPLRHLRLLEINQPGATALTASALRADERIVNAIKGLNQLDERLAALATSLPQLLPLAPSQHRQVQELLGRVQAAPAGSTPAVQLLGADRGSRVAVAAQAAAALGRHLYTVPAESLPTTRAELEIFARLWLRESLLLPIALYVEADQTDAASGDAVAAVQHLALRPPGLLFVGLRDTPLRGDGSACSIEIATPTAAEQHAAWRDALMAEPDATAAESTPDATAGDDAQAARARAAATMSGHFKLNLEQIAAAAAQARTRNADPWDVCRDLSLAQLDTLAQRLQPKARWEDLVLGEEATALLRQIAAQVHGRHRVYQQWGYAERMNRGMGISALFAGESGTGKTMAAEVIANELRLHLFRIDLSSVVSKYIGETEKNLRRLFDAAEQGGAILFFDEADALFGKRSEVKDSHDRYANIEINYLLQRMEAFSGLAILATNMKAALDTAFMRRLRFVVNFPFPGPAERARMWRGAFAPGVPREALDYDRLARFGLSGGNIHSVALNAAFAAASDDATVDMPRLLQSVRAELRKLDKPVNEVEFR